MILTCIYIAAILSAFLSSLRSFRLDFPFHLRLFSLLLGMTLIVEGASALLIWVWKIRNNYWIYNGFTLIEFWTYAWLFYQVLRTPLFRKIVFAFMAVFPVFWLVTVFFVFGFNTWNSYVIIAGSFFTILFVLMYYYETLNAKEIRPLGTLPEFWIATGMLVYYVGVLPFYGTLNFLLSTYGNHVANTLWKVLLIMDTLMYFLFAYAYLCRTTDSKKC